MSVNRLNTKSMPVRDFIKASVKSARFALDTSNRAEYAYQREMIRMFWRKRNTGQRVSLS